MMELKTRKFRRRKLTNRMPKILTNRQFKAENDFLTPVRNVKIQEKERISYGKHRPECCFQFGKYGDWGFKPQKP